MVGYMSETYKKATVSWKFYFNGFPLVSWEIVEKGNIILNLYM